MGSVPKFEWDKDMVKRLTAIVLLMLCLLLSPSVALAGDPTLYENLNTGGDGDSDEIYSPNWTAEQFTSDNSSHRVTSIRVPLKKVGTTPGTVTLAITQATTDNVSTGVDLSTASLNGNAMTTSYVWYDFNITDITLSGNTSYVIVVKAPTGSASDHILWQKDSGGGLADAVGSHSVNTGIDWVSDAPTDYLFEIWGDTVIEVVGVNVFSGYVEEGDWLIALTYKNTYTPYYPNEDPESYFNLQLIDDTTIKAQVNCPVWNYRPGSIYISKSLADTFEWGSTTYKVRLIGSFGDNPYTDYTLTDLDWKGAELDLLDRWVITQANAIGDEEGTTLTVFVADLGEVLNAAGHTMFSIGIPELNVVRPNLFEMVVRQPDYEETEWTPVLPGEADWEVRLGPYISGVLTGAGEIIGVDGKGIGGFLTFVAFMVVFCLLTLAGHPIVGLVLGYPFLMTGAWFGVLDYVFLGVITFAAGVIFVYKVWLIR